MRLAVAQGTLQCPGADYLLLGANRMDGQGLRIRHNLEAPATSSRVRARLAWALTRLAGLAGLPGGDAETVLQWRATANRSDVIFSTVDNTGVPLLLLHSLGLLRRPLVYASVGLPDRLQAIRRPGALRLCRTLYRRVPRFIAYGWEEAAWLRQWLGLPPDSPRVRFVPFGVDSGAFVPRPEVPAEVDVVSVGADMQRDFGLLLRIAARHPDRSFRIIASARHAAALGNRPANVELLPDVPFETLPRHLAAARVVALPVFENTYSAGTTTLLQAMSMARPVVVSRTGAIRDGYGLADGVNCRLAPPGDEAAFERALIDLWERPEWAARVGAAARQTVEQNLTWDHYVNRLATVLVDAASCPSLP